MHAKLYHGQPCLIHSFLLTESPSPDTYNAKSEFDLESIRTSSAYFKGKKKSFCFGAGRDDFAKSVYNSHGYPDAVVPGAGSYKDETKIIGVNARKWSLQARNIYLDDEQMAKKRGHPGPGTYEE